MLIEFYTDKRIRIKPNTKKVPMSTQFSFYPVMDPTKFKYKFSFKIRHLQDHLGKLESDFQAKEEQTFLKRRRKQTRRVQMERQRMEPRAKTKQLREATMPRQAPTLRELPLLILLPKSNQAILICKSLN